MQPHPHGGGAESDMPILRGDVEVEMASCSIGANPAYQTVPCILEVHSVAAELGAPSDANPLTILRARRRRRGECDR
eukprot:1103303-Pleurochrysis_carterae.AAC.2